MTSIATDTLLSCTNLHKHYRMGEENLHVLRGVDLGVASGEWLAILGASGSGKSTLLHLLGGLDRPEQGSVTFQGQSVFSLRGRRLDRYRNQHVGFVFQFYHLLPELTAVENVLIAAMISHSIFTWPGTKHELRKRAIVLLEKLGLGARLKHNPIASPAVNASVSPSRELSSTSPRFCSPTNPRAISTQPPARKSSMSSNNSTPKAKPS